MSSFQPHPVSGLASPYEEVLGLVYFKRMVSKIRLHKEGKLPEDYQANLGTAFDARCLKLLGIPYEALQAKVFEGLDDEALLRWAYTEGRQPDEEELEIWNAFMMKRGWRDGANSILQRRIREAGLPEDGSIATMFDFIDADEGRPPRRRA